MKTRVAAAKYFRYSGV